MGTVTSLDSYRQSAARRRQRPGRHVVRPTFYFDLASPYTYLAAERAERMFAGLEWRPASADMLQCRPMLGEQERAGVERRAAALGMPVIWPLEMGHQAVEAMRVASLAAERGLGAAFVLAASRLQFCGGFGMDDPESLAEASAAAGIELREMLRAAGDISRDGPIEETGRMLLAAGADRLPALRIGGRLFCGEERLPEAVAARASA